MKKPKVKKPKVKTLTDSLIGDHIHPRPILPHRYPIDLYNNKELDIICEWCSKTFPGDEWYCARAGMPGYMFFLEESYVTLFLLMWAK
jgi:hypothetical protein